MRPAAVFAFALAIALVVGAGLYYLIGAVGLFFAACLVAVAVFDYQRQRVTKHEAPQ